MFIMVFFFHIIYNCYKLSGTNLTAHFARQKSDSDSIAVYNLESHLFHGLLFTWTLCMCLWMRPHNIPLVVMFLTQHTLMKYHLAGSGNISIRAVALLYIWLGQTSYFYMVRWQFAVRTFCSIPTQYLIGLYIVYFMWYDTYHDTHEAIFNMYQQYILSDFRPKNLIFHKILGILLTKITNLGKNVSFEVLCN